MPRSSLKNFFQEIAPGALLCITIALAANFIASQYGGPVMVYAILFGIAFNFLKDEPKTARGIQFASKRILQLGVILLGAAVTFSEIAALGLATALLITGAVILTIVLGWGVGRALGLSSAHAVLSSGAVAICGASAAMAIAAVLPQTKESEKNLILTVIGVTTLSTIAMIAYPPLTQMFNFSDMRAGVFLGATIHDVAQVIGAGYIVSDEAGAVAAIVKLMRVTLLAPAVFFIAMAFAEPSKSGAGASRAFPMFLFGFGALMALNSLGAVPESLRTALTQGSRFALVIAVSALGVKTSLKDLFDVGAKPVTVLVAQTILLAGIVGLFVLVFSNSLPH